MGRWTKPRGESFRKGDSRISKGGSPSVLKPSEIALKKRHSSTLVATACRNESKRHASALPGISLRPSFPTPTDFKTVDSSNDIVDLNLLNSAHTEALKQHSKYVLNRKRRPATKHPVSLVMKKRANLGFGVTVQFHCSQCKFVSPISKLYTTTATGGCSTNLQASIALSKIAIKSSDASFLFSSLNVNAPVEKTLERHFSNSCAVSSEILEESLSQNRAVVSDYVKIVGRSDDDQCPSVSVSLDGQYNRPVFHSYDGKSTSVSEPVIENETEMNLLVSHSVVSKHDGTYDKEKVAMECLCVYCLYQNLIKT